MDRPSDETLARRASGGDDEAFGVLYERYHRPLELYCRSIVRHDEDARDAAQSAMAKALVALRRHNGDLRVRPWLYRIAHNEAISLLRARRPHVVLDDGLDGAASDPIDALLDRERLAAALASVRELPGQQRDALLLRDVVGLSHEEIGAAIGTSAVGAKHAVFRARATVAAEESARDEDCTQIRRLLADGDGRRRRSRVVRGHLRGCGACRAWDASRHPARRRRLVAVPAAVASWLAGVAGSAGGGAAGVAGTAKVAASIAVVAATATPLAEVVAERPAARRAKPAAASQVAARRAAPAQIVAAVHEPTARAPARSGPRAIAARHAPDERPARPDGPAP